MVFTQEKLQLGSKDLPHCGVLPVLGLPAPFITSADQGPLLSFISQKEVFPRRVVRERDIELGSGEAVTAKWVLFHQCLTESESGGQTCSACEPCAPKLGGSRRNVLSLPNYVSTSKTPCMIGQQKKGQVTSSCFSFPHSSLS